MLSATALAGLGFLTGCLGSTSELPAVVDAAAAETSAPAEQCPTDFLDGANGYDGYAER